MGYIGMCSPKGFGFSALLVINWVSILAILHHFGHKQGIDFCTLVFNWFFLEATSSSRPLSPILAFPSSTPLNVQIQQSVVKQSVERPSIGQVLAEYRPSVDSLSTDQQQTIARHMIRLTLDRPSPVVGRVSIMYRSICRPSGDRHVDCGSIEVSIATIDQHSIAGVISTHDPNWTNFS